MYPRWVKAGYGFNFASILCDLLLCMAGPWWPPLACIDMDI